LTDRVRTGQVLADEGVIHQRDLGRLGAVLWTEVAAAQKRHTQGLQIMAADDIEIDVVAEGVGKRRLPLHHDTRALQVGLEIAAHAPDGLDSRRCFQPLHELLKSSRRI
jgi:hypothetical protein